MADDLVQLVSKLKSASSTPDCYFQPSKQLPEETLQCLKSLFDFSRQVDQKKENNPCPLSELIVDDFDDEQIWQQIELQNDPVVSGIRKQIKIFKGTPKHFNLLPQGLDNENEANSEESEDVEFDDDNDVHDDEDENNYIDDRTLMPASSSDEDDDGAKDVENNNIELQSNQKVESTRKTSHESRKQNINSKIKGSVVDDKFFKLSEMNEFLDKMDQQFERNRDGKRNGNQLEDDDDDIDIFRDISGEDEDSDDDDDWGNVLGNTAKIIGRGVKEPKTSRHKTATELKYSDYFDLPDNEKKSGDDETMSEDEVEDDDDKSIENDDEENNEDLSIEDDAHENDDDDDDDDVQEEISEDYEKEQRLSRHEKEQEKLKKKIAQLEKENLTKKPWQMSGEAGSTARPVNSLLEEDLNFDHTTAVAPPITEQTTQQLEDIIKQRIKDESWDDVERKQKPVTQPFEYKKKLPLDQEKSKLSLSQIYEQEYVKQTNAEEGPSEEQENEEHKEIKQLMTKLFTKLDALSNFHFTPKPLKPEVKIVVNTPVISMEEVAPVVTSDAMLLAPEETLEKKTELKGDTERTDTDRKRERRAKKLKQRMKAKDKAKNNKLVSKLNPGLGNKHAKKKALERIEKESKSSKNLSVIKDDSGDKALKSSSAFFSQLHDEVKQQVKLKKVSTEKKKGKANISNLKL